MTQLFSFVLRLLRLQVDAKFNVLEHSEGGDDSFI